MQRTNLLLSGWTWSHRFRKSSYSSIPEIPLRGIKVLDLTRIVAGPTCTLSLADYGAEVFKIENPVDGDATRSWPPQLSNSEISCAFAALNRNKKSIAINFKNKEGVQIVHSLAKKCDILIENYVPGVLGKYELNYESLKCIAPRLIYCSLTGFGGKGPYSNKRGVDLIAASMSGLLHLTGPQDGEPCRCAVPVVDVITGLHAHGAILAALYRRNISNMGCKIDVNLFTSAVTALQAYAVAQLNLGIESNRLGTEHGSIVPYRSFKTKDGYITLGCIEDSSFQEFCNVLNIPELVTDKRFSSNAKRVQYRKELTKIVGPIFEKRTTKEWNKLLVNTSLPHGPLNTVGQVFQDEHVKSIGIVNEIDHQQAGVIKILGSAVEFNNCKLHVQPPPNLGQHTDEVLKNVLQYTEEKICELKKKLIIK